jgi:type IV secretory pathway TrbL component
MYVLLIVIYPFVLFPLAIVLEENSMIHSFTVAFGAKYLTGMATSVPPYETFILIKNNTVSSGIRVNRYLVLYVCFVDRYLSLCPFPFGHCVVCSLIY